MKVQRNYEIARHDISPLFLPFHTFLGEIMTLDEHFRCNKKRVCVPVRIGTRYLYIFGIVLIFLFFTNTLLSPHYTNMWDWGPTLSPGSHASHGYLMGIRTLWRFHIPPLLVVCIILVIPFSPYNEWEQKKKGSC